jgi:hypothetical protein
LQQYKWHNELIDTSATFDTFNGEDDFMPADYSDAEKKYSSIFYGSPVNYYTPYKIIEWGDGDIKPIIHDKYVHIWQITARKKYWTSVDNKWYCIGWDNILKIISPRLNKCAYKKKSCRPYFTTLYIKLPFAKNFRMLSTCEFKNTYYCNHIRKYSRTGICDFGANAKKIHTISHHNAYDFGVQYYKADMKQISYSPAGHLTYKFYNKY